MNPITCMQKLKYVGTLAFATVDKNNEPRVRYIDGIHFEDNAMYFFTPRGSSFAAELLASGKVQAVGLTRFGEMIRVSGTAHQLQDEEAKTMIEIIFSEQPSLKNVYRGDTRKIGTVFGLTDMVIDYYNMEARPVFRESYVVGDAQIPPRGYLITDACTECGNCLQVCPQAVIEEGTPYEIEQKHCLRCGACFEICPAKAIEHLN